MTPVQRHLARLAAQRSGASAPGGHAAASRPGALASAYDLQRAELGARIAELKAIQSIDNKIARKREFICDFDVWIEGALAAETPAPDDIVAHVMLWALDIEDYARARPLCEHMVRHRLPLPERFNRTTPTLIADLSAEAALKRLGQGEEPDRDWLLIAADLIEDEDIVDVARAKLEKAIGLAFSREADRLKDTTDGPAGGRAAALELTRTHLTEALRLNASAGVKKDLDRVKRELAKLAADASPPSAD